MKQQDIAAIIVIVFIAGIFSFFVSSKFITPSSERRTAEVVSAIDAAFSVPDKKVFNENAINPTVKIEIAPGGNEQPFSNSDE